METTENDRRCRLCKTFYSFVGRVFIGSLFLVAGIGKLFMTEEFFAMVSSLSLPYPIAIAYAVIGIEILFGALIVIGWKTHISASILSIFTILTILLVHNSFDDPMMLKNIAILGGLFYILAYGPGRISVDCYKRTTTAVPPRTEEKLNEIEL